MRLKIKKIIKKISKFFNGFYFRPILSKKVTIIINGKEVKHLSTLAADEIDREFEEAMKAMSKSINKAFKIIEEENENSYK